MNLNKKTLAGISSVLVFALVLGISSVSVGTPDYMIDKDNYGIQSSAGANAAIGQTGNNTVAGVNGAVEDAVGVVDVENDIVGQSPEYSSFGYTNLGLAVVNGNLNIRKEASPTSKIVGKMTNYAACEILGEENGFYKITTGSAEGYVSVDYIITGEEALAIAQKEAKYIATVITNTLRVRTAPSTDSKVISTISKDEEFYIIEELDGWLKVELTNFQGYISKDYVKTEMKLKTGNTMKELTYGEGISDTRVNLVNFALQYVGGRYVWGGATLGKGVDCSGFTMRVYEKFGIKLPHYSAAQPAYGKKISRSELKPGDLIFYSSSNRIDHVAIYIGNGQIVHAASTKAGIIISNAFYSQPVCYVRYLD